MAPVPHHHVTQILAIVQVDKQLCFNTYVYVYYEYTKLQTCSATNTYKLVSAPCRLVSFRTNSTVVNWKIPLLMMEKWKLEGAREEVLRHQPPLCNRGVRFPRFKGWLYMFELLWTRICDHFQHPIAGSAPNFKSIPPPPILAEIAKNM